MDILSIENLIDIREAVTRRLQELNAADIKIREAEAERKRKILSLTDSLKAVQNEIEGKQYELSKRLIHTEAEDVYLCPRCDWEGMQKNTDTWKHGSYNLIICPMCGEHNLKKI